MNNAQIKAIKNIGDFVKRYDRIDGVAYEIKSVTCKKLDESSNLYTVSIATGMVNDEGTAAELYCRNYRHIFVGPRGGYTAYAYKNGKTVEVTGRKALYLTTN